jgi:hypothetical protein
MICEETYIILVQNCNMISDFARIYRFRYGPA